MKYDVIGIGGGPAGMISAGRAGELGASVLLIEKNKSLGAKLLISGNGRCNITNSLDNPREMIEKFGKNGKFLFSALHKFGTKEVINFFESRGVKIKVEKDGKVFPQSDKSRDVLQVLIDYLKESKVVIKTNSEVADIVVEDNKIQKIILANGEEFIADKFIICTGGKSYPEIGSTGDGYKWLKKMGHTITKLSPILCPVLLKDKFIKDLEGVSLKNIEISLYKNSKKIVSKNGEAIFTANGMSGPVIINLSRIINQTSLDNLELQIDFKPELDFPEFDLLLQKMFLQDSKKMFKNSFDQLLPPKLALVIMSLLKIDPEKKNNLISKEERKKIIHLLKEFRLQVQGLAGYDKAVVTSGGVDLAEVDPKTMKSKIVDNLYLAGEILDLDGPTGGYNLQVCWSTGYTAGESVGK
jgi:predicted Rossmann fold flavoprotein